MKTVYTLLFLFVVQLSFAQSSNKADEITGIWLTGSANAKVQIYKSGNTYQGKIVWLKEPIDPKTNKAKTDTNNPKNEAKTRPLMGLINIWGFAYVGDNTWENGHIYDPKNGKQYKCIITLINKNTLNVRGYIGISLIGRDDTWTRSQL
jgi:uncharacterized protein (DUF2147 family)